MLPAIIGKKVLKTIMDMVWKNVLPELKPLQEYVYGKNDLDRKVGDMKVDIKKLQIDSHPPLFNQEQRDKIIKRLDAIEKKIGL